MQAPLHTVALRLDWATHQAAVAAITRWHYSHSLPPQPHVRVGVWEAGKFVGVVLFSRGASTDLLTPYGLGQQEGCELTRVALREHASAVTRIVALSLKFLKKQCPALRLVVSFADPAHGHHGGIYQGGGWIYSGTTLPDQAFLGPDGKRWHSRTISSTGKRKMFGKVRKVWRRDQCTRINTPGKHRYLMPLDEEMRQRIAKLAKPYPKRPRVGSDTVDTPEVHSGEGGSIPTPTLHPEK